MEIVLENTLKDTFGLIWARLHVDGLLLGRRGETRPRETPEANPGQVTFFKGRIPAGQHELIPRLGFMLTEPIFKLYRFVVASRCRIELTAGQTYRVRVIAFPRSGRPYHQMLALRCEVKALGRPTQRSPAGATSEPAEGGL